jgi:hypothetical protein
MALVSIMDVQWEVSSAGRSSRLDIFEGSTVHKRLRLVHCSTATPTMFAMIISKLINKSSSHETLHSGRALRTSHPEDAGELVHCTVHDGVARLLEGREGLVLHHLPGDRGPEHLLDGQALPRCPVEDVAAVSGDDESGSIDLMLAPHPGADAVAELGRLEQAERQFPARARDDRSEVVLARGPEGHQGRDHERRDAGLLAERALDGGEALAALVVESAGESERRTALADTPNHGLVAKTRLVEVLDDDLHGADNFRCQWGVATSPVSGHIFGRCRCVGDLRARDNH